MVKAHLVQKQAGVQESPGPVIAEHNRPAASFPVSDSAAFFHRQVQIISCKTSPRSDSVVTDSVRFWPNGSGPEASRCAGITRPGYSRTQPARCQFQVQIISCKTSPRSDSVVTDSVRFWPNGSGPEASRCARASQWARPASGQRFWADQDRRRIGSDMFTGLFVDSVLIVRRASPPETCNASLPHTITTPVFSAAIVITHTGNGGGCSLLFAGMTPRQ